MSHDNVSGSLLRYMNEDSETSGEGVWTFCETKMGPVCLICTLSLTQFRRCA